MRSLRTVAALALCLAGCRGEQEPMARLAVEPRRIELGYPQVAELRLTWELDADLARGGQPPTVFVHLLDGPGEIVRTFDHVPPVRWEEGVSAAYPLPLYQSALAPPLPAGTYRLTLGLYDGKSRRRWPLEAPGPDLGRHEYHVADVVVPAPRPGGPHFTFSPQWLPAEPGGDRQILAHRWLRGAEGSIAASGLKGAGALWLAVNIPAAGAGESLAFLDGSNAPSAVISGDCGGMETGVSGVGSHQIEIPVPGPLPGGRCDLTVRANFQLSGGNLKEPRSVALDNLAWNPAGPAGIAR
jgi:hypothetical protein